MGTTLHEEISVIHNFYHLNIETSTIYHGNMKYNLQGLGRIEPECNNYYNFFNFKLCKSKFSIVNSEIFLQTTIKLINLFDEEDLF